MSSIFENADINIFQVEWIHTDKLMKILLHSEGKIKPSKILLVMCLSFFTHLDQIFIHGKLSASQLLQSLEL